MITKVGTVKLGTLVIPEDQQREKYSNSGYAKLKDSIGKHGILVPVIVRKAGDSTCLIVDGSTRVTIARDLGMSAETPIPCVVVDADDNAALVAGYTVNQARERLSMFCEFKTLHQLVGNGVNQTSAAEKLGKTQSWASRMLSIDSLPGHVKKEIQNGKVPIAHAMVLAEYVDDPKILDLLFKESLSGNASVSNLRRIGEAARTAGIMEARRRKPHTVKFSKKSWVRFEPIRGGIRAELHLHDSDDPVDIAKQLADLLQAARGD